MQFGQARFASINEKLNKRFAEYGTLIAAHRGSWHGNIIQNTVAAYKAAYLMGADIVETDTTATRDGVLYSLHDGVEPVLFGPPVNAYHFESDFVETYPALNSLGVPTKQKVERLETVFEYLTQCGGLINIDRCWRSREGILPALDAFPAMLKQAIVKAPLREESIYEAFSAHEKKYMFMPICYSLKDVEKALSYQEMNLVGIELIANTPEDELFSDEAIAYIHANNLYCWVNTLVITDIDPLEALYANLDDDISIKEGPDLGWGKLMDKKIDILQTDWPSLVRDYRASRKSK